MAPSFETVNQVSVSYAPGDTTDGVDCRQSRPDSIVSGHGGYSDQAYGTMQPVRGLEAMRGFSWDRPHYYLPMWYSHNWQTIRNAVWMSWVNKVEGILYTPELDFELNGDMSMGASSENRTIFEIAEINRRMAKVGDVMRQLPKTLSPVAVLQSHRQFAYDVAAIAAGKLKGTGAGGDYDSPHREWVTQCYFAAMETGIVPNWIEEVEVELKGAAFLSQWKVVFCPGLMTATPKLTKALTDYVAAGGKLIQFKEDKLRIAGAIAIGHTQLRQLAPLLDEAAGGTAPVQQGHGPRRSEVDRRDDPGDRHEPARLGRQAPLRQQQQGRLRRAPQGRQGHVPADGQQRTGCVQPARRQARASPRGDRGDRPGRRRRVRPVRRRQGRGDRRQGGPATAGRGRRLLAAPAGRAGRDRRPGSACLACYAL